jgi:hypothetical protein
MEEEYFDGYHSDDSVNRLVELGDDGEPVDGAMSASASASVYGISHASGTKRSKSREGRRQNQL